jgi:hypothetical protein
MTVSQEIPSFVGTGEALAPHGRAGQLKQASPAFLSLFSG